MGQGDHGPEGSMLPGRPRPHYTYSRKSGLKKSQGSQMGLDLTDNEDDDSNLQPVSSQWLLVIFVYSLVTFWNPCSGGSITPLFVASTLFCSAVVDELELVGRENQQTLFWHERGTPPIIDAGLKSDHTLKYLTNVAHLKHKHNLSLMFSLSSWIIPILERGTGCQTESLTSATTAAHTRYV